MSYTVRQVRLLDWLDKLHPLCRRHYAEMQQRLAETGVTVSDYNPRVDEYVKASEGGWLLTFVLEHGEEAVGYCNVYVTHDMHNRDLIAQEDTIYVLPEHRNGCGRTLARAVHEELKRRGVLRMTVTTTTDMRVSKWLERLNYKHTAHLMTINLQG